MKKLLICIVALAFSLVTITDAQAQRRGKGHRDKDRKEYVKYHKKRTKEAHKHARHVEKSYRDYYKKRDHAYRQYIKRKGVRYRDHDRWYYDKRFHQRTEYVYFPAHRTYYDPYRRGYVYRRNNAWVFTHTTPSFMAGVNIGGLNVQFMANIPM